jgi:hypothetical protein
MTHARSSHDGPGKELYVLIYFNQLAAAALGFRAGRLRRNRCHLFLKGGRLAIGTTDGSLWNETGWMAAEGGLVRAGEGGQLRYEGRGVFWMPKTSDLIEFGAPNLSPLHVDGASGKPRYLRYLSLSLNALHQGPRGWVQQEYNIPMIWSCVARVLLTVLNSAALYIFISLWYSSWALGISSLRLDFQ